MKVSSCRPHSGNVLFVTLVVAAGVGVLLTSFLTLVTSQKRFSIRSQSWNAALPVVEAGLEEAMTHLYYNYTNRSENGWNLVGPEYVKTRKCGQGYYRVGISTNYDAAITSQGFVKSPLQNTYNISRTVQVRTTNDPVFSGAVQALDRVDLNGNDVRVDRFDSLDPNYSTITGDYDPAKFKDNGNVTCYAGIVNSVNIGNANVFGKVITGPGGSLKIGPAGAVGSTSWNSTNTGIQPGWTSDTMVPNFPTVVAPTGGVPPTGDKVNQYILGDGVYEVSQVTGNVLVTGDAVLVVNDKFQVDGKNTLTILAGASLKLYIKCSDALIAGGAIVNYNTDASSLQYFGLSTHKELKVTGSANLRAAVYAPDAALTVGGGGGTPITFIGAAVAKSVTMNGKVQFHYDEQTRYLLSKGLVIASWDEL